MIMSLLIFATIIHAMAIHRWFCYKRISKEWAKTTVTITNTTSRSLSQRGRRSRVLRSHWTKWIFLLLICTTISATIAQDSIEMKSTSYSLEAKRAPSRSSYHHPFLVVCTVDGNIVVMDAQDGTFVGGFRSGGPLVGQSDLLDPVDPENPENHDGQRIVPGLDGRLYLSSGEEEILQPLQLTVLDVLNNPVKTCSSSSQKDEEPQEEECGIVTATKSTTLFGLDAATGGLVWQQLPNGTTIRTTESASTTTTAKVLLQREDVLVQQISTKSGKGAWNITLGTLQALDFGENEDFLPGAIVMSEYASPLPSLRFGRDGLSVTAVSPQNHRQLWTQNFGTVVASVFGLQGKSWKKLTVLEDDTDGEESQHGHHSFLPSTISSVPDHRMLGDNSLGGTDLAIYQRPPLREFLDKQQMKFDQFVESWFSSPKGKRDGAPSWEFPDTMPLQPQRRTSNAFQMIPRDTNNQEMILLALPSPTSHSSNVRVWQREEGEEPTFRDGGLFLTWSVVLAIIIAILCVAGVASRWVYLKKKEQWNMQWKQQWLGLLEKKAVGFDEQQQKEKQLSLSLHNDTSLRALLQRTYSLPEVMKPRRKRTNSTEIDMLKNANTVDGFSYFPQEQSKPAPTGNEASMKPPSVTVTTISGTATEGVTATQNEQGVGFLTDGVPLIRYTRYESEFTEVNALGKGGFGTVFRCKNVLDGREYAIKKVWIRYDTRLPQEEFSQRLQRTLREVKSLALLDHPNIVRYYTAWLELGGGDDPAAAGIPGMESDYYNIGKSTTVANNYHDMCRPPNSFSSTRNGVSTSASRKECYYNDDQNPLGWNDTRAVFGENEDESFCHRIVGVPTELDDYGFTFDRPSNFSASESVEITFHRTSNYSASESVDRGTNSSTEHSSEISVEESKVSRESRNLRMIASDDGKGENRGTGPSAAMVKHTLYIQMQFCSQKTLADFLSNEEARKGLSASQGDSIDIPYALSLFLQIAQGVKHVHNQGLIHRDLKPNNCFIDDAGVVKVGDFGLSRESGDNKDGDDPIGSDSILDGDITAGVGTRLYASPEQMKGSDYDSSTDVYSLGIMLFELCYPMYTGMERNIVLSKLRNQIFPEQWLSQVKPAFPILHSLLLSMVSNSSSDRPTADIVVRQIRSILEEYTVSSLDKHHHDTSILLRVEAKMRDGVLGHTMGLLQDAAAPHTLEIVQYGLRGGTNKAIMEFAIAAPNNDNDKTYLANSLVTRMNELPEVLIIRQVTATKYT